MSASCLVFFNLVRDQSGATYAQDARTHCFSLVASGDYCQTRSRGKWEQTLPLGEERAPGSLGCAVNGAQVPSDPEPLRQAQPEGVVDPRPRQRIFP